MKKYNFTSYKFDRNLLFCWATGVGKTYKAEELLKRYRKDNKSPLATYSTIDAYFKQMVKSNKLMFRKPEDWQVPIKEYPLEVMLKCKILLFDDIWVADTTDAYLRDFTFILDERLKNWLTTIFTTNLQKKDLDKKLNERIVSRLLYNTDVVVFNGNDRRLETTQYFEN